MYSTTLLLNVLRWAPLLRCLDSQAFASSTLALVLSIGILQKGHHQHHSCTSNPFHRSVTIRYRGAPNQPLEDNGGLAGSWVVGSAFIHRGFSRRASALCWASRP
jgi:hypothetical protein